MFHFTSREWVYFLSLVLLGSSGVRRGSRWSPAGWEGSEPGVASGERGGRDVWREGKAGSEQMPV